VAQRWPDLMGELARERGRKLFGSAYVLTGSAAAADDLVQTALVKVFSSRRSLPNMAAAEAYVLRAIRTLFVDDKLLAHKSHGDRHAEADRSLSPPTPGVHPQPTLEKALALLSPRERTCVVMRFLDDMTTQAISSELGLAPATVHQYVSDGVTRLEQALGDLGLTTDDIFHGGTETVLVVTREVATS